MLALLRIIMFPDLGKSAHRTFCLQVQAEPFPVIPPLNYTRFLEATAPQIAAAFPPPSRIQDDPWRWEAAALPRKRFSEDGSLDSPGNGNSIELALGPG
jgi:hypothetical protein